VASRKPGWTGGRLAWSLLGALSEPSSRPEPDVHYFVVAPGGHRRVVIASDGLWDVVSLAEAAAVTRLARTTAMSAQALASMGEKGHHARFGKLRDDITVVIVDLCLPGDDEGAPPVASARVGSACGCSVM